MEDNVPTGYEKIALHGSLMYGNNLNTIEAGANRTSIYLYFNQSFGNVNVLIYDSAGNLCYSGMLNTDGQQAFIIPIFSTASGTYYVVLDNANGYAEGDFNKESN